MTNWLGLDERRYTLHISRYMRTRHPIGRRATEQQPRIHDHNMRRSLGDECCFTHSHHHRPPSTSDSSKESIHPVS